MEVPQVVVKNSGVIALKRVTDARDGILCIGECCREIPFDVKRVYYVTNLENNVSIRGKHAHRALQQIIFCIQGSFTLGLDDGSNHQEIRLERGPIGIFLGPRLWHTMYDFTSDCAFMVVASDYYNEMDYVRTYEEFMELVNKEGK